MTDREALALYCRVWGETMPADDVPLDEREQCLAGGVRAMRAAPTLDAAVEEVVWGIDWRHLDAADVLRRDVARLRRMKA